MSRSGFMCVLSLALVACVGAVGCGSESCESARPDLCGGGGEGGGGGPGTGSILGASPATYTEMNEANNGVDAAEATSYVLEDDNGLEITGSFESADPTDDTYVFNSGAFGGASEPDFPGANIRVFVDGAEVDGPGQGIGLSLDTVMYMGYSSLTGDYFINAALFAGEDYELRITPNASVAGKPYTIEIRGKIEEDL